MQEGFEKKIQERMQDFSLEPSPQVWAELESALRENKRRRFAIWWWLMPLMLGGGGAFWYYNKTVDVNKPHTEITNDKQSSQKEISGKESVAAKAKYLQKQKTVFVKNKDHIKTTIASNEEKIVINNTNKEQLKEEENKIVDDERDAAKKIEEPAQSGAEKKETISDSVTVMLTEDSSAQKIILKDTAASTAKLPAKKIKISKQGHWYITVGGGATKTIDSNPFESHDKAADYFDYSTRTGNLNSGNYGTIDSTYYIVKPGNGYHFNAGIMYAYDLSKRWTISGGLQYRYLSNKQKAGSNIDSTFYVSGSFDLQNSIILSQYYRPGYLYNIRNKAHWLEIPLNISYTLNPSAKTKFQLSAGMSYAWMFSSTWLIPDATSNKLYYSKELMQKNIFNWQAGAGVVLPSGWQFGLQYQQSISTVASKNLQPKLYWQNISLHTNIPLPHIKINSQKK